MHESGDVELNPGKKRDFDQCFPVRHWNLSNSVKPNFLIWWQLGLKNVQNCKNYHWKDTDRDL